MEITNLLANFIDFSVDKIGATNLNWIGKIIQWIFEGVGIVGLGVIVFTIALKTIVLPLDVYSRIKTKKQSLVMKKMRPQMEKLQKQYANDKQMYSQKVLELQKANGYSVFGACLPMIVSLVIFIVVFNAFSTYSQYANLGTYNNMVDSYNESVYTFVCRDETTEHAFEGKELDETNGFLIAVDDVNDSLHPDVVRYYADYDKFAAHYTAFYTEQTQGKTDAELEELNLDPLPENFNTLDYGARDAFIIKYVRLQARQVSAAYYRSHTSGFLHVKNVWYPDSMLNKEVPNFSKFNSSISRAVGTSIDGSYQDQYNEVTYDLIKEKKTFNGYFVLIVLAIGFMFLQQFIMTRTQKDAAELGSVDGSAARTNKWMMILMPIIYGIFSFFYSAAFSIYMITNTLYSLITTLIINKVMDVRFAKLEERNELDKYLKREPKRKRLKK